MKGTGITPTKSKDTKEALLSLLIYACITLLFFKDIFTKVYIPLTSDSYFSFYSWNTFFRHCIEKGIFPLWNPLILCGHPYHLESVSNLSLANILLLFLDVNWAWNVKLFISTALSGWFMFLLLRRHIGISFGISLLAAAIYMFFTIDLKDNPAYFMPLIFILAKKWLNTRRFSWMFLLSLALGAYILNANPQFVFYFCIFLYLYMVLALLNQHNQRNIKFILRYSVTCFVPFILATCLTCFRLLPLFQMYSLSQRYLLRSVVSVLLPTHLIQMAYPDFFSSSLKPQLNFIPGELFNDALEALTGHNYFKLIEPPFIGVFTLLLALPMFFKKEVTYEEKYFRYASLIVLLYLMLHPLLWFLMHFLPFLSEMPFVERSRNIYVFSMIILVALSLKYLLAREELHLKKTQRVVGLFVYILVGLIILRLTGYFLVMLFKQRIVNLLVQNILPFMVMRGQYLARAEFYQQRIDEMLTFFTSWFAWKNIYFLIPTALFILSLVLLYAYCKNRLPIRVFLALASGLIALDIFAHCSVSAQYPKALKPYARIANFIQKQPGLFRVSVLQPRDSSQPVSLKEDIFLRPETNLIYMIQTPEGYRSLVLKRYLDFVRLLTSRSPEQMMVKLYAFDRLNEPLADFLNIKYVVVLKPHSLGAGYSLIYEDDEYRVFKNNAAFERAFLVHKAFFINNQDDILKRIKNGFDFSQAVIIEGKPTILNEENSGVSEYTQKVEMVRYEPNRIEIAVKNPRPGYLVVSDCYYPGWRAYVNNKPTAVERANYAFRAIRVASGEHRITLRYVPYLFLVGCAISTLTLFAGLIFCIRRPKAHPKANMATRQKR